MSPELENQINEHIKEICSTVKLPELSDQITWSENRRLKTRGAQARLSTKHIEFSPDFLAILPADRIKELVAHETCHITSPIQFNCRPGHNYAWYFHMRVCGYPNAERCYPESEAVALDKYRKTKKVREIFPNFDSLPSELQAEVLKIADKR